MTGLGALTGRVAAAPISWGVCEVPGWGAVLPPGRVLRGIRACGLDATELGPPGWLPTAELDGLRLVAGFLAIPLHRASPVGAAGASGATPVPPAEAARRTVVTLAAAGAEYLVLAAATGVDGYDDRPRLDPAGWARLIEGAHAVAALAKEHGLDTVLHPHVGTLVERPDEIDAFVADSDGDVGLCLDTGHVLAAGGDPVEVAARHRDRIRHVHLKDVDAALARRVRDGRLTYARAVAKGLYRVLGEGDVDVDAIVTGLERGGYRGWYVLEQDLALPAADEAHAKEADRKVAASVENLAKIASNIRTS